MTFKKQQTIDARDGTRFVFKSELETEDQVMMSRGSSNFIASCPEHGQISQGYTSIMTMFDLQDHADEYHGGIPSTAELLDLNPQIRL